VQPSPSTLDTSLAEAARFWVASRRHAPEIRDEPWFDNAATDHFRQLLERPGLHYLEFGSGGSTVLASRRVASLVSIDSDARYLAAVGRRIARPDAVLMPVDIGFTHRWGRPVFVRPTAQRVARWRRYPQAPWKLLAARGRMPDVVLVDGRFRVACALESLLQVPPESRILVDDYAGRPEYHVIAGHGELVTMHGRMAEFRPRSRPDRGACRAALQAHYADFRRGALRPGCADRR
jgi:hypothetical protein